MFYPDSFKVSTPSEHEIQVSCDFHAPRQLVFDAFTQPELVSRWLLGPPGWTMPVCEIDLRIGGAYRYESKEARDTASRSGMEHGMAAGYNRLEELLSSMPAGSRHTSFVER